MPGPLQARHLRAAAGVSQRTTVIAGDAAEHLERGQVLRGAFDIEKAQESLLEVIEIADRIIPGHDNELASPKRRGG